MVGKQRLNISSPETNGKGGDGGLRGRSCYKKLEKQEKGPRGHRRDGVHLLTDSENTCSRTGYGR
jgi:hypothetical protein